MGRMICFLCFIPLFLFSGTFAQRPEIPEANEIPDWPAPTFWTPPAARAPGRARTDSVITASAPLPFVALPPCRIVDTRGNGAPIQGGMFAGGSDVRSYDLAGICGLPTGIGSSVSTASSTSWAVANTVASDGA